MPHEWQEHSELANTTPKLLPRTEAGDAAAVAGSRAGRSLGDGWTNAPHWPLVDVGIAISDGADISRDAPPSACGTTT